MTEGHKVILKREIALMSKMMLEKCPNGDGSAQKSAAIMWKWFIQDHAPWGMQGGDSHEQGALFP